MFEENDSTIVKSADTDTKQLGQLAGHSISSVCSRYDVLGEGYSFAKKLACISVSVGVGRGTSFGESIYNSIIKPSTGISTIVGFSNLSSFGQIEGEISESLSPYFPSQTSYLQIHSSLICSMIWGGYLAGVESSILEEKISLTCLQMDEELGSTLISQKNPPISRNTIDSYYQDSRLSLIAPNIALSPKIKKTEAYSFGLFDTSGLFTSTIDLQKMKDSEIQNYTFSGKLIYQSFNELVGNLPDCQKIVSDLRNSDGIVTGTTTFITNFPCSDEDNYYGPPQGVEFNRRFSDGPYSSGIWLDEYKDIVFNIEKANQSAFLFDGTVNKSLRRLQSPTPLFNGEISTNIAGPYSLKIIEKETSFHDDLEKTGIFHLGQTGLRWKVTGLIEEVDNMEPVLISVTGYKTAALFLSPSIWSQKLSNLNYNPNQATADESPYYRAMALESNLIQSSYNDEFGALKYYVGGPIINSSVSLPYLVFSQDFDSVTFNKIPKIKIGCGIGISSPLLNGEGIDAVATGSSYEIQNITWFTGQEITGVGGFLAGTSGTPNIDIYLVVPSSGLSESQEKVLGMGNSMDGMAHVTGLRLLSNAGYQYYDYSIVTGTYPDTGILRGLSEILNYYSPYLLGSPQKTYSYLDGYRDERAGTNEYATPLYATGQYGELVSYNYLDRRQYPFSRLDFTDEDWGLTPFPEPSNIEEEIEAGRRSRILREQRNENFVPRFQKGPFRTLYKNFLYPNASGEQAKTLPQNGFPYKVTFKVDVIEQRFRKPYSDLRVDSRGVTVTRNYSGEVINTLPIWNVATRRGSFYTYNYDGFVNNFWTDSPIDSDTWTDYYLSGRNSVTAIHEPKFKFGCLLANINGSYADEFTKIEQYRIYTGIEEYYNEVVKPYSLYGEFSYITGYSMDLTGYYVLPAYNLQSQSIKGVTAEPVFVNEEGVSIIKGLNQCCISGYSVGQDPVWFEDMTDNTGIGLKHSRSLVGDAWMALGVSAYPLLLGTLIDCLGESCEGYSRIPEEESRVFLFNLTTGGLSISTKRGMCIPGIVTGNLDVIDQKTDGSERLWSVSGLNTSWEQYQDRFIYFTGLLETGALYPIPTDIADFTGMGAINPSGCRTTPTVEEYWIRKGVRDRTSVKAYRFVDLARLGVRISNIKFEYGEPIYDSEPIVDISGQCIISGQMRYHSQAESAVFSEGVILEDITEGDSIKEIIQSKNISQVLERFTGIAENFYTTTGYAPSRVIQRKNYQTISLNNEYIGIGMGSPYYYNKYLVPAISDLSVLNPDWSIEAKPPIDNITFPLSSMITSAAKGQPLSDGKFNPNTPKIYAVKFIQQFYDGLMTDALKNPDYFITNNPGVENIVVQEPSGYVVTQGTTLSDIRAGLA